MKIFRFDKEVGKPIIAFGSNFTMSRIGVFEGQVHLGCMHFEHGEKVGRHDATTNQLFLVIEGSGWVSGEASERVEIKAGEAAFWFKGESHEQGAFPTTTMKAIVIEGEGVDPEKFMHQDNLQLD